MLRRQKTLNLPQAASPDPEGAPGTPPRVGTPPPPQPPSPSLITSPRRSQHAKTYHGVGSETGRRGAMLERSKASDAAEHLAMVIGTDQDDSASEDEEWQAKTLGKDLCFIADFLRDEEAVADAAGSRRNSAEDAPKSVDRVRVVDALPEKVKLLLLYFSARWCPLCIDFDAVMQDVYHSLKALPESEEVELVWVSADICEETYRAHLQTLGSILAVAWDPKHLDDVMKRYNVVGVPTLLVLDAEFGRVVSSTGREDLLERTAPSVERQSEAWEPHIQGGVFVQKGNEEASKEKGPNVLYTYWRGLLNHQRRATLARTLERASLKRQSVSSPRRASERQRIERKDFNSG